MINSEMSLNSRPELPPSQTAGGFVLQSVCNERPRADPCRRRVVHAAAPVISAATAGNEQQTTDLQQRIPVGGPQPVPDVTAALSHQRSSRRSCITAAVPFRLDTECRTAESLGDTRLSSHRNRGAASSRPCEDDPESPDRRRRAACPPPSRPPRLSPPPASSAAESLTGDVAPKPAAGQPPHCRPPWSSHPAAHCAARPGDAAALLSTSEVGRAWGAAMAPGLAGGRGQAAAAEASESSLLALLAFRLALQRRVAPLQPQPPPPPPPPHQPAQHEPPPPRR